MILMQLVCRDRFCPRHYCLKRPTRDQRMLGFIAQNSQWLQSFVIKRIARLSVPIEHNVEKVRALKKAFYLANCEAVAGDYLEFGMYEGSSFIAALECHESTKGQEAQPRKFWGFDSFEGFRYSTDADQHPFFRPGEFKSSYQKTLSRLSGQFGRRAEWDVLPGYIEDTIGKKTPDELGIQKIAVALIDCDLGEPARVALEFMAPVLQPGSVIVLDDFFAYAGSNERGVAGAFANFQKSHPELVFRRLLDYGYGGQAFIVAKTAEQRQALAA
ncbi:MAG: class I SAM-dependent methyltransferase [Planctomycetes bacterium]|nr:class I SAM-dependent methyltransferase [Planctomycetota bacterium]